MPPDQDLSGPAAALDPHVWGRLWRREGGQSQGRAQIGGRVDDESGNGPDPRDQEAAKRWADQGRGPQGGFQAPIRPIEFLGGDQVSEMRGARGQFGDLTHRRETKTSSKCTYESLPATYPTGTLAKAAHRPRSTPIITGRLRRNSTHAPTGRTRSAPAAPEAATIRETCRASSCRTTTASNGKTPIETADPSWLIPYADHNRTKSRPGAEALTRGRLRGHTATPTRPGRADDWTPSSMQVGHGRADKVDHSTGRVESGPSSSGSLLYFVAALAARTSLLSGI